MTNIDTRSGKISFQGFEGAYSHLACHHMFPNMDAVACNSFEQAFTAVQNGDVDLGMIPIDNSSAGRVADIHHLLPESGLYTIGEHFEPVIHHLLARKGAKLADMKEVYSHLHTVGQVRKFVKAQNLEVKVHADNAGAAKMVSETGEMHQAAIASSLAAELYGLDILNDNINDREGNTTRFIVLSREEKIPAYDASELYVTSMVFETRSVPAALYKALGGFATNGVNITKLESYITDGTFDVVQFYVEVEGHREDERLQFALEELAFFARVSLLGTYKGSAFRKV